MGSKSPKELLLEFVGRIEDSIDNPVFNTLLLGATAAHMVLQSARVLSNDPTSAIVTLQDEFDFSMIWVYTGVMCLRIWGRGLVWHPTSFLRQGWSLLDCAVVLCAWLDRVLHFGNLMFFMFLRMFKLLVESKSSALSSPRKITRALLAGITRVAVVFGFLVFVMIFIGVLAIQLIGTAGDFHNRCGVELCEEVAEDGTCLVTSRQALVPIYLCRQSTNPEENPQGTCPNNLAIAPLDLNSAVSNAPFQGHFSSNETTPVRCLGPDLLTGKFDQERFARLEGLPLFNEYIPVNYSDWKAPSDFNWDNLQKASVAMFTIFYKTAWVQFLEFTVMSTSPALIVAWILLLVAVAYYLLNLTVGVMCLNYSESVREEEKLLAAAQEEDDDEDDDEGAEEDEEEEDLAAVTEDEKGPRQKLLDELNGADTPVGSGLLPLKMAAIHIPKGLEAIGNWFKNRYKIFAIIAPAVTFAYNQIGKCYMLCCTSILKVCVILVQPAEEGGQTPFNKVTIIFCILYLFTLAAQDDNFNKYKCGCPDDLEDIGQAPPCPQFAGTDCGENKICSNGRCVEAWAGTPCINPWSNPLFANATITLQPEITTGNIDAPNPVLVTGDAALAWEEDRKMWCNYSMALHYFLMGWGVVFLVELVIRYLGHQGFLRFFTVEREGEAPKKIKPATGHVGKIINFYRKIFPPRTGKYKYTTLHVPNCIDTAGILVTIVGIVLTEVSDITNDKPVFNQNLSLLNPSGEPSWEFFTPTAPRAIKFFRMAIIVRVLYQIVMIAQRIPIVAVILRGFRGAWAIIFAGVLLFVMTWFFMLLGREFFLYYGPDEGCNECLECSKNDAGLQDCIDICAGGIAFTGCNGFSSEADCNPNMCTWSVEKGHCRFDGDKGGVCRKNQASSHFYSTYTFDDNTQALILLFDIVIGANWYDNTADGVEALGYGGLVYFVLFFYITNYQFLRIFVAIIAQNYELSEDEKLKAQKMILNLQFKETYSRIQEKRGDADNTEYYKEVQEEKYDDFSFNVHYLKLLRGAQLSLRELASYESGDMAGMMDVAENQDELPPEPEKSWFQKLFGSSKKEADAAKEDKEEVLDYPDSDEDEEDANVVHYTSATVKKQLTLMPWKGTQESGAQMEEVPAWKVFKKNLGEFCESDKFNFFVMLAVIASTIAAMITFSDSNLEYNLSLGFLAFFVLEMLMKQVAFGLFGRDGYFTQGWNQLDFALVMLQIFDVAENTFHFLFEEGDPNSGILKGFRALRVARLLSRLQRLGKNEGANNPLKTTMQGLGASMPAVFTLVGAVIILIFFFALIGMEQFSGVFDYCNESGAGPTYDPRFGRLLSKRQCIGNTIRTARAYTDPEIWHDGMIPSQFEFLAPMSWGVESLAAHTFTFNNVGDSFFTLYNLLLQSGMASTAEALNSITERDQAPQKLSNTAATSYIILYRIIGGIFVSQVVIGIIMTNLKMKSGLAFHTMEQMVWPATKQALLFMPSPYSGQKASKKKDDGGNVFMAVVGAFQEKMKNIQDNWKFKLLADVVVLVNCASLASTHFGNSVEHQEATWYINFISLIFFVIEAFVKCTADPNSYFKNPSDQFDLFITLIGIVETFIAPLYGIELGLGSLRMFRLLRVATQISLVVNMLQTVQESFPQAAAVVVLLAMNVFIFAAIGSRLFPFVRYGFALRPSTNLGGLGSAMILMFQASSGAGGPESRSSWGHWVKDTSVGTPYCTPVTYLPDTTEENAMGYFAAPKGGTGANPDCGNATISVAFFFIFAFACNFVILPTFVASIINSYFQANLRKLSLISEKQLVLYRDVWKDLMESDATLKVSDPAQDKFDNLIMQLEIRGCILGFSPDDKQKYNMAKAIIKHEQRLEYKTTAITLFSIREKCRPVTIVDILRRQRAVDLIVSRGKNLLPKQKKIPEGKLHASVGIPEPSKLDKSKSVLQNNAIFSYNIFVILEQLTRIEGDSLSQRECAILKKLVEDNDEDLFTYFEEYVETAGEQFDRPHRYRAMLGFAARAKIVVAQSEYVKDEDGEGKPAKGAEGDGEGGEEEEDDAAAWPKKDEEDEPEEEAKDDEEALEEDLETAQFVTKSRASQQPYGQHVRLDGDTVLDLRGWRGCDSCGEPVNETWDQCPNCKTELAGAKQ